jgi:hypothetical protein
LKGPEGEYLRIAEAYAHLHELSENGEANTQQADAVRDQIERIHTTSDDLLDNKRLKDPAS